MLSRRDEVEMGNSGLGGIVGFAGTAKELSVYESMAATFDVAARNLNLDDGLLRYLRTSNHEIIVHIPVAMKDGKLEVFEGYRVQHSIARGPCKGGVRYSPHVTLDEDFAFLRHPSPGVVNLRRVWPLAGEGLGLLQ